ncbi:MAG: exo-alpha-sialidase [Actinobacteria bacterium]|nr:exo-alpha-sialidase [Actinomycetota bacterium]
MAATIAFTASAADVKITDRPYQRHDGGTDVTIASCSNDAPGTTAGGERQQNEPAAAVDPNANNRMTAGSNDYCSVPTTTDAYAGFYWSDSRGASWKNSLLPGYPTDTSAEGSNCNITPQHCLVINTGDPVQAFDRWGHVFYGVIGFNRSKPSNGSIFAARYDWSLMTDPDYRWTALVARGTPTGATGKFEDKVQIEADRGVNSPYAGSAARPWGNVYLCYAQFVGGNGNNGVFFARSTDGGRTYSHPQKISEGVKGSQFCDIAVTSNGTVYVAWRQFENSRGHQIDAVVVNKSTNGGASFGKPEVVTPFIHWDVGDLAGAPKDVREGAMEQACEQGDGIDCADRESESGATREQTPTRACGDGPFVCESGYVFFREDSEPRIAADATDTANPNAAYIVYNATVPGSETPTGTSYGTVEPGIGSQGQLYFTRTDGGSWMSPTRVTPAQAKGHQFFPDIDANAGKIHVVWQDSRHDTASGPPSTPSGGDYRTVPISNKWVSSNPPGSVSTGPGVGVESYHAVSTNRGGSFTEDLVSSAGQMPQYEQFGSRNIPFFGDYNSISAVGNTVLMDWTDMRDPVEVKPGNDPRYTNGDGMDGFDVLQCRTQDPSTGAWSGDTCPNAGGLDENIFGSILGP